MRNFLSVCFVLLAPAMAEAMVCRAAPIVLRIDVQNAQCLIGDKTARRRDTPDAVECLLSDPQLRIITLYPDGRFTYDDTDDDTFRVGICTPD